MITSVEPNQSERQRPNGAFPAVVDLQSRPSGGVVVYARPVAELRCLGPHAKASCDSLAQSVLLVNKE